MGGCGGLLAAGCAACGPQAGRPCGVLY